MKLLKMMTSATFVVILFMALISMHGESCKLTLICKDEHSSQTPFPCSKSECDELCSKSQPNGWGKCKDDDPYVCQCFYICYKDIDLPKQALDAYSSSSPEKS